MLIVSNFVDYYDELQNTLVPDSTNTIFYRRRSLEDALTTYRTVREIGINSFFNNKARLFIIGFCGRVFSGIKLEDNNCYYTLNGALYHLEKQGIKLDTYDEKLLIKHLSNDYEYVFPTTYPYYSLQHIHYKFSLEANPCLMDFDFKKVLSAARAYRMIESFVLIRGSLLDQTGWGGGTSFKKQLPHGY